MPKKSSVRKLLEGLTREKIIDFIVEYAKNNSDLKNAIDVRFGKPEFKHELDKIEAAIDAALGDPHDYPRYSRGWGYITVDTGRIIDEIMERAEQGNVRLAFAEIMLLYRKLLEIFEYQEECEISDEVKDCLRLMSEIAGKAAEENDKKYIFNECIALCDIEDGKDFGADYEDKLLKISAKLVTKDNVDDLNKAVEIYEKSWHNEEAFAIIRYEIIRKTEGRKAADEYINSNLEFDGIRKIAFEKAVKRKDYDVAEKLCADRIKEEPKERFFHNKSEWCCRLYSVYQKTENIPQLIKTAEEILLRGDLKYYDELKKLLKEQNLWELSYNKLLKKCELQIGSYSYAEILAKENETSLLLKWVKSIAN